MEWILGIGAALVALFILICLVADKNFGKDMENGGLGHVQFATAVILCALMEPYTAPFYD